MGDERVGGGDRLRVLYSFPHALGSVGIGTTAWHQVVELARAGHRVDVVAASVARPLPVPLRVRQTLAIGSRRIPHRLGGVDRTLAGHDMFVSRLLTRRRADYDVVHTWPRSALRTLSAARALGIPGLREAPNTHVESGYRTVEEELQRLGLRLPPGHSHHRDPKRLRIELQEYAAARAVLVPSTHARDTFLAQGHPEAGLLEHRYGYDPSLVPPVEPRRPGPLRAIFLGRGEPRKGLHLALEAWLGSVASSRGGTLVVCGTFVPGYRTLLSGALSHPSITVLPHTTSPFTSLAAADVLLLPSVEEGSALVTYEAQAVGCVPLVSHATGAPVVHDLHGLVHPARDVRRLREHLDAVSTDPALLGRLRNAALAHAPDLTWQGAALSLAASYRKAAALPRTALA